jgi:hypothetical protein
MISRSSGGLGPLRISTSSSVPRLAGRAALAGGLLLVAVPARAQVGVQLGVVASTNLVSDSIVSRVAVRANPALALGLSGEMRVDRYRVGASVTVSRSDLVRREPLGAFPVTRLTVWQPSVYLRQPFLPWLSADARASLFIYDSSVRDGTFFRSGAPVQPGLGAGLRLERRLSPAVALGIAAQYDIHRFSTPALRAEGFTGHTYVHRFSLLFSVRRIPAHERASN